MDAKGKEEAGFLDARSRKFRPPLMLKSRQFGASGNFTPSRTGDTNPLYQPKSVLTNPRDSSKVRGSRARLLTCMPKRTAKTGLNLRRAFAPIIAVSTAPIRSSAILLPARSLRAERRLRPWHESTSRQFEQAAHRNWPQSLHL